jgi:hypothetical protein
VSANHEFDKFLAFMERLPAIHLPAVGKSIGGGSFDTVRHSGDLGVAAR